MMLCSLPTWLVPRDGELYACKHEQSAGHPCGGLAVAARTPAQPQNTHGLPVQLEAR